jgi:hypothetical protein
MIMKNFLTLALTLVLITACKDAIPRYASASPEIDVVKAHITDYEEGKWDSWMGHYADTAKVYHNTTKAGSPKEAREGLSQLLNTVSNYEFEDEDIFYEMVIDDQGERWVNFWGNWKGTLAANEKTLTIPVHLTLQFVDGKIVEEHAYYDLSAYAAEMQAIEAAKMTEEETLQE